ncbi:hypothetical protein [Sphingomonas bacterium]|uniref:hypothetical protein n=1 Tax=Sphingomonas bacterium TaxID=1895847 RepID=UPI0015754569|nr:hypothetical protein [Sphingomonas bacterium]
MNVDTLSIARERRAADLPPEQAEASATKVDLDLVHVDLEAEGEQNRSSLDEKSSSCAPISGA